MQAAPSKSAGPRVNDDINVPQVLLIDDEGEKRGVVATSEAIEIAVAAGLDLVEVSPNTRPPVCKILDYGKYKYQQQKKKAEAKKAAPKKAAAPKKEAAAPAANDDLTQLSGVGPALAKKLNEAGVTSFAQVAAWTEADMEALGVTAKAEKGDWIAAAKALAAK